MRLIINDFLLTYIQEKSPAALDLLDQATNCIKQLEENVNELKERKDGLQLPVVIDVNESETGESFEINIVCRSEKKKVKMHKVFQILEEEGAEVVSASSSTVGLKIYHTILCKVCIYSIHINIYMHKVIPFSSDL